MKSLRFLLTWTIAAVAAAPLFASEGERIPVVGRDGPDGDACPGIGKVAGLDPERDLLPVLVEPDENARRKDRLAPSTLIWLCDAEGEWQGIVYASGEFQELGDCRVSSPVKEPEAYSGPCKYGWVRANRLHLVAG